MVAICGNALCTLNFKEPLQSGQFRAGLEKLALSRILEASGNGKSKELHSFCEAQYAEQAAITAGPFCCLLFLLARRRLTSA